MIGDLWRMVVGRFGYLTIVLALVTLYLAANAVYAFPTPLGTPMALVTMYLGIMTWRRAVKFAARKKAEQTEGSLPLPGSEN